MEFPTLYKSVKGSEEKWQIWNIWVEEKSSVLCFIKRRYGLEQGKMIETTKEVTCGKNKGKKNETTVFQQACLDAQSLFNKQKDTNKYTETKTSTSVFPSPMLAHSFEKQFKKITFPCLVQPKLDGVRMISRVDNHDVRCYSRTGKLFDNVPLQNIVQELTFLSQDFYWDGELFSTELLFEDIVGACRTSVIHDPEKYERLEYHVYDMIPVSNPDMTYQERYHILEKLFSTHKNLQYVRLVSCDQVQDKESVYDMHDKYVSEGYEGVMIRNRNGTYQSTRSYHLQKYKHFVDHEYTITDVKEAVGTDTGTAIIQCETCDHHVFWVRPRGSREYRARLLKDQHKIFGKQLTVRYQNLTDKGIPRFPVGISVRDYE
jgi:ATP-dependent DNA ligase